MWEGVFTAIPRKRGPWQDSASGGSPNRGSCATSPYHAKGTDFSSVPFAWWEGVDSNHRSRRRQIYSLMHLATLQPARIKFLPRPRSWTGKWSWRLESNPQPADYKSAALPVELRQHFAGKNIGALGWNRTADIRIFSPALYQLSYQGRMPHVAAAKKVWRPETGSNRRPPA